MKRCLILAMLLCSTFLGFSQERKAYNAPLWDVYITDAEPGTEFYLLGECTEVMIENRQLKQNVLKPNGEKYKLIAYHKLSNHKQKYPVYREIRGQEGAFKGAYYPADSLLLSRMDSTERAYIISELQCKGRYEEEPVGFMARVSAGLDPKSKKDIQKTAEFFNHYFEKVTEAVAGYTVNGWSLSARVYEPKGHHFGSEFIELQDSQNQIHYIPVYETYKSSSSYTLDYTKVSFGQFIESNYYDWLQDTFVGKEICLMGDYVKDDPPYSTFDFIGLEKWHEQEYIKNAYKCVGFKLEQDSDDVAVQIENYSFSTPHLKRYSKPIYDIGDLTDIANSETLMEIAVANCMLTTSGDFITSDAFDAISKGLDVLRDEYTIKSFITKMYNEGQYEDYAFLQKHCSQELLQKLQEAYLYDTDGVAYAVWLFRSGMQDAKPESDEKTTMLDIKNKGDWYTYTALDMGWKFTNSIKVIIKDSMIVITDMLITQ